MQRMNGFALDRFWVRRKILTLLGQKFHVYDMQNNVVAFCKQKAFKLKEDIRVYSDESQSRELLSIRARKIIDWSVAYDVTDSQTQEKIGALKRRGWKSAFWRDEWVLMDAIDREIGNVQEDSALLAFIRRNLIDLVPQTFNFTVGGGHAGQAKQNFNFFAPQMHVDFSADAQRRLDRRLALASVILLMAIEGRQD
jgi:uncharacterized protein YxjI